MGPKKKERNKKMNLRRKLHERKIIKAKKQNNTTLVCTFIF